MAMSLALTQLGYEPGNLSTTANVYFDMGKGKIEMVELNLTADSISGLSSKEFEEIARGAKENCLISKALTGLDITLSVEYNEG